MGAPLPLLWPVAPSAHCGSHLGVTETLPHHRPLIVI